MAFHVVGAGGLLDEPGPREGQVLQPVDGHRHVPHLVGVDHQAAIGPEHLAGDAQAADVVLAVAADLELHMAEAGVHRFLAQASQLVVRVAEPAGRGRVAGIALALEQGQALGLALGGAGQQHERLVRRDAVGEVAEVDAAHQLLGAHVGDQAPQRLALGLGPQVPDRVDDGAGGQVDRALVGSDPAQLAVRGHVPPEAPHVGGDPIQVQADDEMPHRLDGAAAQVVAAPDGEGQAVALQARPVRLEDDVGGRVIRIGIHRVGAVQVGRRGEAHVDGAQIGDAGHRGGVRGGGIQAAMVRWVCVPSPAMPSRIVWSGRR